MTTELLTCTACRTDNHPGRQTCRTCGIVLVVPTCTACRFPVAESARYCAWCGLPLSGRRTPPETTGPSSLPA